MNLQILVLLLGRQLAFATFLTIVLIRFVEHEIQGLGSDPALVPVWWPIRSNGDDDPQGETARDADISLLDPDLSGRILSIQAQNQYVEVCTPMKSHLLRIPFQVAIGKMPSAAGHRVHRSWWLANEVPVKLARVGQNYRVEDAKGRTYPVSKPNLDMVRALIDRNSPASGATEGSIA